MGSKFKLHGRGLRLRKRKQGEVQRMLQSMDRENKGNSQGRDKEFAIRRDNVLHKPIHRLKLSKQLTLCVLESNVDLLLHSWKQIKHLWKCDFTFRFKEAISNMFLTKQIGFPGFEPYHECQNASSCSCKVANPTKNIRSKCQDTPRQTTSHTSLIYDYDWALYGCVTPVPAGPLACSSGAAV